MRQSQRQWQRDHGGADPLHPQPKEVAGIRRARYLSWLLFAGLPLLATPRHLHAQIITPPVMHPGAPADADRNPGMPPDPMQDLMADKSKLARNDERQRKLVSDTDRLLLLANQLKSEVAASGSETMTPLMLHQMDEIEKLARSVKEKMRN